MPVLMWEERVDGKRFARVKTSWRTAFDGEEHRELAEMLDAEIDEVLDGAVELLERNESLEAQREFIRTWSMGRAIAESGILDHDAMRNEQRINLWQAMEQKALLGVRADGEPESRWSSVRSNVKHVISRPDRHLFGCKSKSLKMPGLFSWDAPVILKERFFVKRCVP